MALLGKIITALAAIIPALLDWWTKRKAAETQAEIEARNAAIRDDPGSAWVHKFNAADQQHSQQSDSDHQTDADQSAHD